jgi:mannose-1-phosphate guanylyltransferase
LPKQFLSVEGRFSLLQDTVRRLRGMVPPRRIFVVAPGEFRQLIRKHLGNLPAENLLIEPCARGTAACLALAAARIGERDPEAAIAVFPADHVIRDRSAFQACVRRAFEVAERQRCLVTFGIKPTHAETGYGYIRVGKPLHRRLPRVYWASRFVEKPGVAKARTYLRRGDHYWNSGMFVWRADVLREALEVHAPEIARAVWSSPGRGGERKMRTRYRALGSVSIDVAVMEKARRVAVVEGAFDWSDVGSWAAMSSLWSADGAGNARRGDVVQIDCRDTIAFAAGGRTVAMLGVENLVVVDSPDALLVCPKDRAQEVRRIVDILAARRRKSVL